MLLDLRDYQEQGLNNLRKGFSEGHKSQILYGPCAFGKTEVAISMLHGAAENGKRAAMVMDRRVLVDQTSARLDKYEVDHGVMMANHCRYIPYKSIQICSAQTLEAKGTFPNLNLLIVDECHQSRRSINEFIKNRPDIKVVGLTGSPFTRGLGSVYSNVVSSVTINELVNRGFLAPLRVFKAKQIDMTGAKKVAGEWSDKEATQRGIQITGDVVQEWIKKTHDIFGEPKKTIVFCAGVAHGKDLKNKFNECGYRFETISYKDTDDTKSEILEEFSRPDSGIIGLIATDILTKGFDQADVMIGISARPFSKSFSSHVQQLGRLMRPHESKDAGIWLDHSGNFLRFYDEWEELYHHGVNSLDDGKEKPKPEPSEQKKEAAKCHVCGEIFGPTDTCQHCGAERQKRNLIIDVPGTLEEIPGIRLGKSQKIAATSPKELYDMLCAYARWHSAPEKQRGRAAALYKDLMGEYPPKHFDFETSHNPNITQTVLNQIKRKNIAYAKARGYA